MAYLRQISPDAEEIVLPLTLDEVVIGRADDCAVQTVGFSDVSRQHCGLKHYEDGVWTVTDFGSRNGTFVNDEQIFAEKALAAGDRIRVCARLEFIFEDPPEPEEPPHKPTGNTEFIRAFDEVEQELEHRDYHSVMKDLVRQARPRPRGGKPPAGSD